MAGTGAPLADFGIVYFGNEWFAENRTSSHHIARRLAARCTVLYVDSPGMRAPRASGRDLRRLFSKLAQTVRKPRQVAPQLWHCTVPQVPLRWLPGAAWLSRTFGIWAVRRAIASVGMKRRLSWFVVPHPGFLAGRLGEDFAVYYCIDDYAAHPGVDRAAVAVADESLTRCAHQVFVAPPALVAAKRTLNRNVEFAPHGVDFALFATAADGSAVVPARARSLGHPVIGFFGLLGDWVDVDLLAELGRARPQWTFLIVGHVATDAAPLLGLPNFVFVGAQPYEELPGWASAFDVAIMPYRQNRQVRNANPLKLREYLATGRPVVSVPTPEVERFAPHVRMASGAAQFLSAIEKCLQDDDAQQRAARMEFVRPMSWDARVAEVLKVVDMRIEEARGAAR